MPFSFQVVSRYIVYIKILLNLKDKLAFFSFADTKLNKLFYYKPINLENTYVYVAICIYTPCLLLTLRSKYVEKRAVWKHEIFHWRLFYENIVIILEFPGSQYELCYFKQNRTC